MTLKALVFGALLLMCVSASPTVKRSNLVGQIMLLEEPCVRQGGMCLHIDDCPKGSVTQIRGVLCPAQVSLGAECCYV